MKFSLIVYSPPEAEGSRTALNFANAVLAQGHELYRVFFYGDGVCNGALSADVTPAEYPSVSTQWCDLARSYQADLVLCVTAAEQRGITRPLAGFQLSGLGQLVDAIVHSDRCVTFR